MDSSLLEFIKSQKLLTISTIEDSEHPWIFNVYYSSDENLNLYYLSPDNTSHTKHIAQNPNVAFSTAWFDQSNLGNRKSIQGKGTCQRLTNIIEITQALKIYLKTYPDWAEIINLKNILNKVIESKVYKITPNYMKFWNDELFGEEGTKEYFL